MNHNVIFMFGVAFGSVIEFIVLLLLMEHNTTTNRKDKP